MAIYDHDSVNARPDNPQDTSNEISVTTTAGWYNYTVDVECSANPYWLGVAHSGGFRIWYDTAAASDTAYKDAGYTFPDPFGSCSFYTRIYSFYANYTTEAGEEPVYLTCYPSETISASASLSAAKLLYSSGSVTTAVNIENGAVKSVYTRNEQTVQASSASSAIKALYASMADNAQPSGTILSIKQIFFLAQGVAAASEVVYASKMIYGMVTVTILDTVLPSAVAYCIKSLAVNVLAVTLLEVVSPVIALYAEYSAIVELLTVEVAIGIAMLALTIGLCAFAYVATRKQD
jgi:hypothetical protein